MEAGAAAVIEGVTLMELVEGRETLALQGLCKLS